MSIGGASIGGASIGGGGSTSTDITVSFTTLVTPTFGAPSLTLFDGTVTFTTLVTPIFGAPVLEILELSGAPTYPAGTRADAIRILDGATEVKILSIAGTVPGVTPLAVGGAAGPGKGTLRQDAAGRLLWKAPGATAYGLPHVVASDGSYVVEGTDASKYIRVQVDTSFQVSTPAEAKVHLQDRYNELGPDDVTAGEATSGNVETKTLTLENQSGGHVRSLLVWIDSAVSGLEISDDGSTWVSPTAEGSALAMDADLAPGATDTLYLRRTVSAGASSDASVLHQLHFSHYGV